MKHPAKEDFFKAIYWDNEKRIVGKRNLEADYMQWEKNAQFLEEEEMLTDKYYQEKHSVIFIVGVPRSGTTFLSQLLLKSFDLGAFYNAVAKNYSVPLHAYSKLNLQQKDEMLSFSSNLGNTTGDFSSHEFGYFWQYWLKHQDNDELSNEKLAQIDWKGLKRKLYAICGLLNKDLLIKSIVYNNFIIEELAEKFPKARFIYIQRDPFFVVQSILKAREKQYGSEDFWWSIRPKQFKNWLLLSNEMQVANQVIYTDRMIQKQLSTLNPQKYMHIKYEGIIDDVESVVKDIETFLSLKLKSSPSAATIQVGNQYRLSEERISRIIAALALAGKQFNNLIL